MGEVSRNHSIDALRGVAVMLMWLDHGLSVLTDASIEFASLRFVLHFAQPVFVLLFGYYLFERSRGSLIHGAVNIALASCLANVWFFTRTGNVEILGSFLALLAIAAVLRSATVGMLPSFLLFAWDPSRSFLDYPLSIVASQVAAGALLRKRKGGWCSLLLLLAPFAVAAPYSHVCVLTPIGAAAILGARQLPSREILGVSWIGRHALLCYVVQFPVLATLDVGRHLVQH